MRYHLIGISGIGMSGLARLLSSSGFIVSGSDLVVGKDAKALQKLGVKVYEGHSEANIESDMQVVYSSSIRSDNPEWIAAKKLKCKTFHRSELLAGLATAKTNIFVTGSHGKTTTSSLLAWTLYHAGLNPSFAVGGIIKGLETNANLGEGNFFVAEADESDGTFLNYCPDAAIITNVDEDHMEYFETKARLENEFQAFAKKIKDPSYLFWNNDDPSLSNFCLNKENGIGFHDDAHIRISHVRFFNDGIYFDLNKGNACYKDIFCPLFGKHFAFSAASCFALLLKFGLDEKSIRMGLASFPGVRKRGDLRFEKDGVLFYDDYAHHPRAISATLEAFSYSFNKGRLIAIFEPHRYTRLERHFDEFVQSFEFASHVFVTDTFAAGTKKIDGIEEKLAEAIRNKFKIPAIFIFKEKIKDFLADFLRPRDLVLTMNAGSLSYFHEDMELFLKDRHLKKWKLAILTGGSNTEREISFCSASTIKKYIDQQAFEISEIVLPEKAPFITQANFGKIMEADIVFPILHGPYGEDGTLQGALEMMGKPYVGCGTESSCIAMQKDLAKAIVKSIGIATSPWESFHIWEWVREKEKLFERLDRFQWPLFVKPCRLGSTYGITKVKETGQLFDAFEKAFSYDTHILVEEAIDGREIECAVFGNEDAEVFPPGEIMTYGAIFDYEKKYGKKAVETLATPDLTERQKKEVKQLAARIYRSFHTTGMARIDFFLDLSGKFWFNEMNPIPGFTENSIYPKMVKNSGMALNEFIDRLIFLAFKKHAKESRINLDFINQIEYFHWKLQDNFVVIRENCSSLISR